MRTLRTIALGHVALLLVASSGCAAKTTHQWIPEQVRAGLGTVAVVTSPEPPEWSFAYPVPSRAGAAAAGAGAALGVGAAAGAACLGTSGYFFPACFVAVWTPVMMVTNAFEGAVKGVPIADVKSSAASLKNAVTEPELATRLAERVASEGQRRGGESRVRLAADGLPDTRDLRYAALASAGVNTVVEVQIERLQLERAAAASAFSGSGYGWSIISVEKLIDAPLQFTIAARVRVVRAADGTVVYEMVFNRRTGYQKFTEWGREEATGFRGERDSAIESIAQELAGELFGPVLGTPDPASTSEPTTMSEPTAKSEPTSSEATEMSD